MRQLTYVEAGGSPGRTPPTRSPPTRPARRPPARGRPLRPRSDHGRLRHLPRTVRRRPRDGRRGRRRRRRGPRAPRRRACPRPLPGLVRRMRPCRDGRFAACSPTARRPARRSASVRRAAATAARSPTCSPCRTPTTCCSPPPTSSRPPRSARSPTTSPTASAPSGRTRRAPRSRGAGRRRRRGSIGLYAVAAAIACGAGRVRYIDTDAARCEAATALGAEVTHLDGPWPRRFERAPIVVENTADVEGLACALRSTDDYGTCTSVAIHFAPTTPMPLLELYTKGITYHLSRADSRRFLPEVIALAASGALDPLVVPTTIVPWDEAPRRGWSRRRSSCSSGADRPTRLLARPPGFTVGSPDRRLPRGEAAGPRPRAGVPDSRRRTHVRRFPAACTRPVRDRRAPGAADHRFGRTGCARSSRPPPPRAASIWRWATRSPSATRRRSYRPRSGRARTAPSLFNTGYVDVFLGSEAAPLRCGVPRRHARQPRLPRRDQRHAAQCDELHDRLHDVPVRGGALRSTSPPNQTQMQKGLRS